MVPYYRWIILLFFLKFSNCLTNNRDEYNSSSNNVQKILKDTYLETFYSPIPAYSADHIIIPNVLNPVLMVEEVIFELYTKSNLMHASYLKIGDIKGLQNSTFNSTQLTKIIIHGWTDNRNTFWLQHMRRNYLMIHDYNIICVSWFPGSIKEYLTAVGLTRQVGEYLAQLLNFLADETGLSFDNVHILGHSLGAHIAGFTGTSLAGRIGRITGMDPARPAFESPRLKYPDDRLDSTDANFVDIIHTCAGTVGFVSPIGHADFYPNGGSFRQPGCPVLSAQYCSHSRSHEYFAESIINPEAFVSMKCNNWMDFKMGACDANATVVNMGEEVNFVARGTFFLRTNSRSPFGKVHMMARDLSNISYFAYCVQTFLNVGM